GDLDAAPAGDLKPPKRRRRTRVRTRRRDRQSAVGTGDGHGRDRRRVNGVRWRDRHWVPARGGPPPRRRGGAKPPNARANRPPGARVVLPIDADEGGHRSHRDGSRPLAGEAAKRPPESDRSPAGPDERARGVGQADRESIEEAREGEDPQGGATHRTDLPTLG